MLEQRSAAKKGFITLREAADISGYAPDYIGQLIRGGKIEGEQVYSSVAWVTTEASLKTYMAAKNKSYHQSIETDSFHELAHNFSIYLLYIITGTLGVCLLIAFYIFSVSLDKAIERRSYSSTVAEFEVVGIDKAPEMIAYD